MLLASRTKYSVNKAFTLTELLICVAILGLIATFTIPKVVVSIDQTQNEAKFKEAIAVLEEIGTQAYMEGRYNDNRWNYLIAKVNAIKICPGNAVTQGCTGNLSGVGELNEDTQGAFVLPNGVTIGGFSDNAPYVKFSNDVGGIIDINGPKAPNVYGQDVMEINLPAFKANGGLNPSCGNRRLVCPTSTSPPSATLYNSLFD